MGRETFESYGRIASLRTDPLDGTFRYACQERDQRLILPDVLAKLDIRPSDDVLEIGCGPFGLTLVPLAFLCNSVTGVDHPRVVDALRTRVSRLPNVRL